jgi:hypothetical protein
MPTPIRQRVSVDSAAALEEFSDSFDAAFATATPDDALRAVGLYEQSAAIKTTYPIPVGAAGYKARKGDDKFRRLYQRSLTIEPEPWQDGVEELAAVVEAPDFNGWAREPERMAREAARHPAILIAAMLEENPVLDFYRDKDTGNTLGIRLFADNHPVNIFDTSLGTFDNDHAAAALDGALFSAVKTRFRARLASNGRKLGTRVTHILVPGALEETARAALETDLIVQAVSNAAGTDTVAATTIRNRHMGTISIVVVDELTVDDVVYFVDAGHPAFPWVYQDAGQPEEIRFDKSDHKYKTTGLIAVSYILNAAVRAALPHAIERVELTG